MGEARVGKLLTIAETAQALSLKISTVRSWIATRKLPQMNGGRPVRIPDGPVAEFVERNIILAREKLR